MGVVVLRPDPLLLCASTLFYRHLFFLHHLVLTTFCSTTECSSFLFVNYQIFLCRFFVAQIFLFCQSFVCNLLPISFFFCFSFFFLFGWGEIRSYIYAN